MRYERKYRILGLSLAEVEQLLNAHPASFRSLYPDRQVNSIYLDTVDYHTWNQNVMGQNERKKYRIRWYGPLASHVSSPQFEIKQKHNELGWKEILPLADFNLENPESAYREIFQKHPELSQLEARLINSYTRSYLISFDGKFRLTLDRTMRFYSPDTIKTESLYSEIDPGIILEIKYEEENDKQIHTITQYLPFRQTKHSKYVQGVQLIR